jgi:hypothetical protein
LIIVVFCKPVQALAATHESLRLAYSEAGAQLLKMQEQKRTSAYKEVRTPHTRTMKTILNPKPVISNSVSTLPF